MPDVEIYDETWNKLEQFKKVVESILADHSVKHAVDYVDLVLKMGLDKMISDLLPDDESILKKDVVSMFNENPNYISKHISDTLELGKKPEDTEQVKKDWSHYA